MKRILGIDPGSRKTGFGIVEISGNHRHYVTSGIIRLKEETLADRLRVIFNSIQQLIEEHQPECMAVEEVFFAKDPRAALKLGQARGAAIAAASTLLLPVGEYSAKSVKKAVVGTGAASKEQVQHMVTRLLNLPGTPAEDAADALAVALCHAQSLQFNRLMDKDMTFSKGRIRIK